MTGLRSSIFGVTSKTVDSSLDALFSTSAGPVKPSKITKPSSGSKKPKKPETTNEDTSNDEDEDEDENESKINSDEVMSNASQDEEQEEKPVQISAKERKRKRKQADEELETKYLQKLAKEEEEAQPIKRHKSTTGGTGASTKDEDGDLASEAASDDESDVSPEDLVHESLQNKATTTTTAVLPSDELEKASRTVFLANVASGASTNKAMKKALMAHMGSILDSEAKPAETIESIRFRSLAFSTAAMPKRAAFITKSMQEATTKSCNAYVVYSTPTAARKACAKLNGTKVLDRHLRVDSVSHPAATDGRRCVFVGNLGFVDDESVFSTDGEGNTEKKKRNKVPSDIEEGLWRVFNEHAGSVESVRVVRDAKTRVGKGFAYVQFYDANYVEKALLLNTKKFPPMLPRALRVTRAKDPRKTNKAVDRSRTKAETQAKAKAAPKSSSTAHVPKVTNEEQSMAGRAGKLLGRSGALHQKLGQRDNDRRTSSSGRSAHASGSGVNTQKRPVIKTPEGVVLEGRRASANDGKPNDIKFSKKGRGGVRKKRPTGHQAKRTSEWKKKTGAGN
ncbi:Nucleolar protein 12 [Ceratocystis pirilliformis]|uniref:Nucleolar protein 12 n=1 Tax=Ceratocystis pirilliformis TaxID=259994 RepID=A0ABR3YRB7_9PEZI